LNNNLKPVFAVSVTYGKRWHFLKQAMESMKLVGVDKAIIVNNGSADNISELVNEYCGDWASVIDLGRNTGSANAFKSGMEAAVLSGAEFVLLLDDDNVLESGALQVLLDGWRDGEDLASESDRAVLAFRPEHQADIAEGLNVKRINPRADSFFGFHVYDIAFKLWRRTPFYSKKINQKNIQSNIRFDVAPYSGMFFHRKVLEKHGFPDPKFVLYADDTEFSYRLAAAGGGTWLLTDACIRDLESSWNVKKRFGSTFDIWLSGEGDRRAYYAMRNQAYFEKYCRKHSRLMRAINKIVYLGALRIISLVSGRDLRYKLLMAAMHDGEIGKLGVCDKFPLVN